MTEVERMQINYQKSEDHKRIHAILGRNNSMPELNFSWKTNRSLKQICCQSYFIALKMSQNDKISLPFAWMDLKFIKHDLFFKEQNSLTPFFLNKEMVLIF